MTHVHCTACNRLIPRSGGGTRHLRAHCRMLGIKDPPAGFQAMLAHVGAVLDQAAHETAPGTKVHNAGTSYPSRAEIDK